MRQIERQWPLGNLFRPTYLRFLYTIAFVMEGHTPIRTYVYTRAGVGEGGEPAQTIRDFSAAFGMIFIILLSHCTAKLFLLYFALIGEMSSR